MFLMLNRLQWWMVWRYLTSGGQFLNLTSVLSILGLGIGVAALVVAMAIISGFQITLKGSVIDVFGDVVVAKSIKGQQQMEATKGEIQKVIAQINGGGLKLSGDIELLSMTPYATVEGVVVHKKRVSGIVLQGLESSTYASVLNLEPRIVRGRLDLSTTDGVTGVAVGKALAEKFGLSTGDVFKVVVPIMGGYGNQNLQSRVKVLKVNGVLTLGRYEYDLRNILIDLRELQGLMGWKDRVSGLRLNIQNPDNAILLSQVITARLGEKGYWAMNWRQVNNNLFAAIDYERVVIFIILMIIIVAASFNVASTLFVSVLKKFRDISIMQAMGMTRSMIKSLFVVQGLIIGIMGYVWGLGLGLFASWAFIYGNRKYGLLNGEVYKLDGLELDIRFLDLFLILVVCLSVCYLSTLAPSSKGGALPLVDGLKYE